MPISLPAEQKKLLEFLDRRHPRYWDRLVHWLFCRMTHDGGREWFDQHLFRYIKEGDREWSDRKKRAYRFNHTREVVGLVTKYIFKIPPIRNLTDAPERLRAFWRTATMQGLDLNTFMRRVTDLNSIYGRIWVGVDTNATAGPLTLADERASDIRAYAYTVTPDNMLDWARDEAGRLLWTKHRLTWRDDADPVLSSGDVRIRYMIWTAEEWVLLEEVTNGRRRTARVVGRGPNAINEVPLFEVDPVPSDDPYDVPGMINDIAYLDRAVANYLSNLDAIIQDQTFSQLVIPAQGLLPGDDALTKLIEMGTKRIFTYDGEAGSAPVYISPDPKQAQLILEVINKIISEIYHSIGMAGERTKQDNAVGIDNSSGVAKAYDFERINGLLASRADVLERCEDRLAVLVGKWLGFEIPEDKEAGGPKDLVKYPDNFDVRGLYDEFEIASNLSLLQAPEALRREQMRVLIEKLLPRLADEVQREIAADLKGWPPSLEEMGLLAPAPGLAKPAAGSRQGQVTPKTAATPRGSSSSSQKDSK